MLEASRWANEVSLIAAKASALRFASQVRVAIEVPHGPVVESLLAADFAVHSINPRQLDRFRDRFSPSGCKDDRRDAEVLADSLRTDGDTAAKPAGDARNWRLRRAGRRAYPVDQPDPPETWIIIRSSAR